MDELLSYHLMQSQVRRNQLITVLTIQFLLHGENTEPGTAIITVVCSLWVCLCGKNLWGKLQTPRLVQMLFLCFLITQENFEGQFIFFIFWALLRAFYQTFDPVFEKIVIDCRLLGQSRCLFLVFFYGLGKCLGKLFVIFRKFCFLGSLQCFFFHFRARF